MQNLNFSDVDQARPELKRHEDLFSNQYVDSNKVVGVDYDIDPGHTDKLIVCSL